MKFSVHMVVDAEQDLLEIYRYVLLVDSLQKAEQLLEKLEFHCLKLETFPERGRIPPELQRIGVIEYRELLCSPYRIIYQIKDKEVFIHCILDGRRSLQELLEQRLIRVPLN